MTLFSGERGRTGDFGLTASPLAGRWDQLSLARAKDRPEIMERWTSLLQSSQILC